MFKKQFLFHRIALIAFCSIILQSCASSKVDSRLSATDNILGTKYETMSGFIPFEKGNLTSLGLLPDNMKVGELFLGADYMFNKYYICNYWNRGLAEVNPLSNPYYIITNHYFTCEEKQPFFDFLKVKDKDGNYVIPGPPRYIKGIVDEPQ